MNSFVGQLKHLEEVLAFKLPAKLYIITNDGTFGDKVAEKYKIPEEKVRFWLNGRDKPNFPTKDAIKTVKKELDIRETDFVLLAVSRLIKPKRVDRTIKALKKVIVQHNNVKLVIVGDGEERKKLEKLVENLNLKDNIGFVGPVFYKEVNKFYSIADIFLPDFSI